MPLVRAACVAIARSHCYVRAARMHRAGEGGNGAAARAARLARVRSMPCARGARSQHAGCGDTRDSGALPALRRALAGLMRPCPARNQSHATADPIARGPICWARRALRAQCLTRVAPPQRAGNVSHGPAPCAVLVAGHRAPRRVRVICARRRGARAQAARPHASAAHTPPPTTAARAPLCRAALQWCVGARSMRVGG